MRRLSRTWQQLKGAGRGIPVVLGGDQEFMNLTSPFTVMPQKTAEKILEAAAVLKHPEDLVKQRAAEVVEAREWMKRHFEENPAALPKIIKTEPDGSSRELSRDEVLASMLDVKSEPKIGEWPAIAPENAGADGSHRSVRRTSPASAHRPHPDGRLDDDSCLSAVGRMECLSTS